jgi:hypothetical protein
MLSYVKILEHWLQISYYTILFSTVKQVGCAPSHTLCHSRVATVWANAGVVLIGLQIRDEEDDPLLRCYHAFAHRRQRLWLDLALNSIVASSNSSRL